MNEFLSKEKRLLLLLTKVNMLTNLCQSRLAYPLIYPFNTTALNNDKNFKLYIEKLKKEENFDENTFIKSLSFITPSIIFLTKLIHILKAGHTLCNNSQLLNLNYIEKKRNKSILNKYEKKLHLLKPQVWRLLKPNDEINTKYLKWRK